MFAGWGNLGCVAHRLPCFCIDVAILHRLFNIEHEKQIYAKIDFAGTYFARPTVLHLFESEEL